MMKYYMNRYIRIVNNEDNSVICSGRCVFQKIDRLQLVSLDNKYFFHVSNSKRYHIVETDDTTEVKLDVDKYGHMLKFAVFTKVMSVLSDNKVNGINVYDIDVFVENNEYELDKEMVEIVRSLNRIRGLRTTGSCSGHYLRRPWVIIEFTTLSAISDLNRIVNDSRFCDSFILSNDSKVRLTKGSFPSMTLFCTKKLPFAKKYLKKLVEYIDSIT